MKSKLSSFKISTCLRDRISPSNTSSPLQKITSGFNHQLVQSPLMNRASSGFNLVSPVSLLGGGPASGFIPGTSRFFHGGSSIGGFILFSYMCFTICVGRIERVPYTSRFHYVVSDKLANNEDELNALEKKKKQKLPKSDPRVIRVESVARNILKAMNEGLMLQHRSSRLLNHNALNLGASTRRKLLWKPTTKHLDGKDWGVYVRDSKYDSDDDCCILDGKIFVPTGILEKCKSDAELATVLGHEIGRYVARHLEEDVMKLILLGFFFIPSSIEASIIQLVAMLHFGLLAVSFFSRRMGAEADHIGLMLMASAGYDPQVAPEFYEYLDRHSSETNTSTYSMKHPGKKRAELLKEPLTMELAKQIFEEVKAGKGVRSFI